MRISLHLGAQRGRRAMGVVGDEPLPAGIRRKGRADKTLWQSMP